MAAQPLQSHSQSLKKSDQDYTDNSKGRKFLKTKLSELDTIRQTAEFKKFGFGIGGPYAGWVEDLKSEGENMELRMWEMQGVSFLALLATTYASNNGREDASTKQARDYVQEVIDTPQ